MDKSRESSRGLRSIGGLALVTVVLAALLLRPAGSDRVTAAGAASPAPASVSPSPGMNPPASPYVNSSEGYVPDSEGLLRVPGSEVDPEALRLALRTWPDIRRAELPDAELDVSERLTLRQEFPHVEFVWPVDLFGHRFLSSDSSVSLAGRSDLTPASLLRLRECAALFTDLRSIDLTGCGLPYKELHALDAALPETDVVWTMELYGRELSTADELFDLSGLRLKDKGARLEAALPYLPRLKKVVMCDCGLSDEEMDALNKKYEDVRFVWTVNILTAAIRTDSDFFIPYRSSGIKQTQINAGYKALKYCPDLIALDIGHSHTRDISYLTEMPHMKYFIMVECFPADMTPVGTLKELEWLEMFQCVTKDISPLVNCTALRDLNICYLVCPRDNIYETLRQMKWLRRLWCSGCTLSREQLASLREELPDTEIWSRFGDESTGSTWRFDEDYYDMRDAFHMYYMDITGNRVRRMTEKELQAIHEKFWK